jgi:DNA-binding Lrp family transcriptional regulator
MALADVDPLDLFILNKLHDLTYGWEKRKDLTPDERELLEKRRTKPWLREGASITTLDKVIKRELGLEISRSEVERRIEKLASRGILLSTHSIVIDPTKLFNHVAHIYLKIPISSPLRSLTWWEAVEKIWEVDKKPEHEADVPTDIIRELGVIEGTGEYDVILFVYTNDMNEVSRLLKKLTTKGYIEKSMTQRIWTPTGIKFDPIKVPDYEAYVKTLTKLHSFLESIHELLKST